MFFGKGYLFDKLGIERINSKRSVIQDRTFSLCCIMPVRENTPLIKPSAFTWASSITAGATYFFVLLDLLLSKYSKYPEFNIPLKDFVPAEAIILSALRQLMGPRFHSKKLPIACKNAIDRQ